MTTTTCILSLPHPGDATVDATTDGDRVMRNSGRTTALQQSRKALKIVYDEWVAVSSQPGHLDQS